MTGHLIRTEILTDQKHCDPSSTTLADNSKSTFQRRLRRVLNRQENKICLDCSRPGPRWASIISIPPPTDSPINPCPHDFSVGGFCCLECSGAHRTLGTHLNFVRSVDFDSLNEREIRALEMTGNAAVNSMYEGRLFSTEVGGRGIAVSFTKEIKPDASSDQNTRELFIRNKYSKKMYLDVLALNQYHQRLAASLEFPRNNSLLLSPSSLILSPSSSSESTGCQPPQLQIFTSSPRTLAMLEKYMNPKPKKKKLSKRIKAALGMKKHISDGPATRSDSDPIVIMPTSLKIHQTRSIDEVEEEYGPYSDDEYNIELVKKEGRIRQLVDLDEDCSVTSTKSLMTTSRRRKWSIRHKKHRSRRKNKKLRKTKLDKTKIPLSFNDEGTPSRSTPKVQLVSPIKACPALVIPPIPKLDAPPKLHIIVDEDSSQDFSETDKQRDIDDDGNKSSRDTEISMMALWSRGLEWAILRRFRT